MKTPKTQYLFIHELSEVHQYRYNDLTILPNSKRQNFIYYSRNTRHVNRNIKIDIILNNWSSDRLSINKSTKPCTSLIETYRS